MNRFPSVESRIAALRDWFSRENKRPLLGFFLDSQYPLHRYKESMKGLRCGRVFPEQIDPEDFLSDYKRLYQLHEAAGGDLIWSSAPFFGLPWVEASLGCTVIADLETGSTHTEPPSGFRDNPVIPPFDKNNPWVKKLLDFIPVLKKAGKNIFPVGTTLIRGISDILSALYGNDLFLFRMIDAPDEVLQVVDDLTDYWIAFGKTLLKELPLFYGGTGSFFYCVWCPGKTIWMQEDAAALLSPDLYERFIFPANVKMTKAFEHSVMHLHPTQFIPASYLVNTSIDVIELHIDKGGPRGRTLEDVYRIILDKKPLVIWGDLEEEDLVFILEYLAPEGLLINMVLNDASEAERYWNIYKRFYGVE